MTFWLGRLGWPAPLWLVHDTHSYLTRRRRRALQLLLNLVLALPEVLGVDKVFSSWPQARSTRMASISLFKEVMTVGAPIDDFAHKGSLMSSL